MNEKLSNVLAELAEKFGTTVEHLWGVMLRQAYIDGVMSLVYIGVIVSASVVWWKMLRWYIAKDKSDDFNIQAFMDDIGWPLSLGVGGFVLTIALVFGVPNYLYWAVTAFCNPEYWALKQVIR